MPMICYGEPRVSPSRRAVIDQANEIIREYADAGYDLTLRQLYYQFVSRDLIANRQQEYKRLGDIVSLGRRAGLIDWDHIVDRTRNLRSSRTWSSPGEMISGIADAYALDLWRGQDYRPEVWIEKDALVGLLEGPCGRRQTPYFSCRGYNSDSEAWAAAQRMEHWIAFGQEPVVFHLGDHDPSGIDMTRDIAARLELFSGHRIRVERLALNMDQIDRYGPPPNPAKTTDSRFEDYEAAYGSESWELDALSPPVIDALISEALSGLIDPEPWNEAIDRQNAARERIRNAGENWESVVEWLAQE